jgi:hypothetical protein
MTDRLGNIIYFAACALALVWAGSTLLAEAGSGDQVRWGEWALGGLVQSALIWGVGRAVKYILTDS